MPLFNAGPSKIYVGLCCDRCHCNPPPSFQLDRLAPLLGGQGDEFTPNGSWSGKKAADTELTNGGDSFRKN